MSFSVGDRVKLVNTYAEIFHKRNLSAWISHLDGMTGVVTAMRESDADPQFGRYITVRFDNGHIESGMFEARFIPAPTTLCLMEH